MQGLPFRSPLFGLLRHAVRVAAPSPEEGILDARLSRRHFLFRAMQATAAIGAGSLLSAGPAASHPDARVPAHRGAS